MHLRLAAVVLSGSCALSPSAARAWSTPIHVDITSRAVDTLPSGLKAFYKVHKLELPSLAPDATSVDEGADQRFKVDAFQPFPFTDLPRSESALKARYPEAAGTAGRLPWLIQESYERLVAAFKSGDKAKILEESDAIARLAADLRNPLALTTNFDGEKTGQNGVWARFSSRLPEALEGKLKLHPDDAHLIDDTKEHSFAVMRGTYVWIDNILYAEDLAQRGRSGYGESYYEALGLRAKETLESLLSLAVSDVGSYWYTAWTAAGRPVLK